MAPAAAFHIQLLAGGDRAGLACHGILQIFLVTLVMGSLRK
jgi:hypothetical protein